MFREESKISYSDAERISEFFLSKSSMSNKKLQKLLYYSYSWTLVLLNQPEAMKEKVYMVLFPEEIQAWVHGPVIPDIYFKYKKHGWKDIPKIKNKDDLDEEVKNVLEQVWEVYGEYSADELESISHQEDPWKKARKGLGVTDISRRIIRDEDIYKYYYGVLTSDV